MHQKHSDETNVCRCGQVFIPLRIHNFSILPSEAAQSQNKMTNEYRWQTIAYIPARQERSLSWMDVVQHQDKLTLGFFTYKKRIKRRFSV